MTDRRAVKTHRIRGRRYHIRWDGKNKKVYGTADAPTKAHPTITIYKYLKGRSLLYALLHESLHACFWDMDEEAVTEAATDISHLLWRLGYRRQKEDE